MSALDDLIARDAGAQAVGGSALEALIARDGGGIPAITTPKQPRTWTDVIGDGVMNIPKSAGGVIKGIYDAVSHPIDTVNNVADLAAGGLHNITPKPIANFIDSIDSNAGQARMQKAVPLADAVGQNYKSRYGSVEGIKNTIAEDPIGAAMDLSTVLGGAGGAVRATGKAGVLADALAKGSSLTNPINAIAPVIKGVANGTGIVGKNALGVTTGVGAENIAQAVNSGIEGKTAFFDNLSGKSDMTDVLNTARQNVQNMGTQKSAAYRSGMVDISKDKSVLGFDGINKALDDANNVVTFKGQIKNAKAAEVSQRIAEEVNAWKSLNPAQFHTPEGLDALKQKIGGIVESLPFEEKTARMVGGNVYNAIKNEITAQAPTYSKTMGDYAAASENIKEIERALSLGNRAAADTAMRKLQSLSRNNVNTNYGNRLDLAKALEKGGGNEILPAIAGQAMNSWTPRGLAGQAEGIATLGLAALHNPLVGLALPFQSPKAVGSALYGAGKTAGIVKNAAQSLSNTVPLTSEQIKNIALILNQGGNVNSQTQKD
jgi:hypothetical protein